MTDALAEALREVDKHFGPFADVTINGLHNHDDVRVIGLVRAALAAYDAAPRDADWRDDPEGDERWCAGSDYALTRLCAVLGVDPAKVDWDGSDGSLQEEADSLIWRILHANDDDAAPRDAGMGYDH